MDIIALYCCPARKSDKGDAQYCPYALVPSPFQYLPQRVSFKFVGFCDAFIKVAHAFKCAQVQGVESAPCFKFIILLIRHIAGIKQGRPISGLFNHIRCGIWWRASGHSVGISCGIASCISKRDMPLYRGQRDVELLCDLLMFQPFDASKQKGFPGLSGKGIQYLKNGIQQLACLGDAFRGDRFCV